MVVQHWSPVAIPLQQVLNQTWIFWARQGLLVTRIKSYCISVWLSTYFWQMMPLIWLRFLSIARILGAVGQGINSDFKPSPFNLSRMHPLMLTVKVLIDSFLPNLRVKRICSSWLQMGTMMSSAYLAVTWWTSQWYLDLVIEKCANKPAVLLHDLESCIRIARFRKQYYRQWYNVSTQIGLSTSTLTDKYCYLIWMPLKVQESCAENILYTVLTEAGWSTWMVYQSFFFKYFSLLYIKRQVRWANNAATPTHPQWSRGCKPSYESVVLIISFMYEYEV